MLKIERNGAFSTDSISSYYESDIKVQDSYDKTSSDSCSDDEHVLVIDTSVTDTDSDDDNVLGLSEHLLVSSYEGIVHFIIDNYFSPPSSISEFSYCYCIYMVVFPCHSHLE